MEKHFPIACLPGWWFLIVLGIWKLWSRLPQPKCNKCALLVSSIECSSHEAPLITSLLAFQMKSSQSPYTRETAQALKSRIGISVKNPALKKDFYCQMKVRAYF